MESIFRWQVRANRKYDAMIQVELLVTFRSVVTGLFFLQACKCKAMRELVLSTIDWFIPHELIGKYEQRQARRAIIFALAILIWAPVFGPAYHLSGSPAGGLIIAIASIAMVATMVSLRYSKSVFVTGHLITIVVFSTMVGLATRTGGPGSPSLWWLLAAPIVGLVICGIPSGVAWAAIGCLACFAFLLNDHWKVVVLADDIAAPQLRVLSSLATAGIILCVFSLTLAFKLGEDSARGELEFARQESEAANKAKSQFLANMSHEIRTPLNAVIGLTELVLDTDLTPDQRDDLTTVMESGESLLVIINEILDFSKIEAGKIRLELVPLNLRAELCAIQKELALRAERKDLEFNWNVDANVPDAVMGDPWRLRQVLVNLTANAIKFTHTGKVTVAVHCGSITDHHVDLCFEIHDTGIGIAPEKLDAIFSEFEQADTSTTRKFGGTGLGLSISSRLVSLMGGRIEVQSDVGRASTFRFTIPFGIADFDAIDDPFGDEDSDVARVHADAEKNSSDGLKILLAEDGITNQKLAVALLERWGHSVAVANDGRVAVSLWENGTFDLILMDIQMPELDGIGATELIRDGERQRGGHIPIIALTAHALTGDRERFIAAGMDGYVSKPIRRAELAKAIELVISKPL